MIDLKRRGFLFGVAAVAAVVPVRSYFLMPRRPIVIGIDPGGKDITAFVRYISNPRTTSWSDILFLKDVQSVTIGIIQTVHGGNDDSYERQQRLSSQVLQRDGAKVVQAQRDVRHYDDDQQPCVADGLLKLRRGGLWC